MSAGDIIDNRLHRHASSRKDRRSAKNIGRTRNELSLDFSTHVPILTSLGNDQTGGGDLICEHVMESVPEAVATGSLLPTKLSHYQPYQVATSPCTDLIAQIRALPTGVRLLMYGDR